MSATVFTPGDVVEYRGTLVDDRGLWVFAGPSDRTPPNWPELRYRLVRPDDRLESVGADSIGPALDAAVPEDLSAFAAEIRAAFEPDCGPFGVCRVCGKTVGLSDDGTVTDHISNSLDVGWCRGDGKRVELVPCCTDAEACPDHHDDPDQDHDYGVL